MVAVVVERRGPQYQREYRAARKALGLCTSCASTPALPGKTKCARHDAKTKAWWKDNPEYARANQVAIHARRSARTDVEVLADQQRLRPSGLKLCKRRSAHAGPIPLTEFWRALGEADGLHSVCKSCSVEAYRRRAEKHWRAMGVPFVCTYCGGPYEHVDHVVPRALGGTDDVANLVPACRPCNQSKSKQLLDQWLNGRVSA